MKTPWREEALLDAFAEDFEALVAFASASRTPGGFAALDAEGVIEAEAPIELWITCRMTYVFTLASMCGIEGAAELAEHGVNALNGPFRDETYGGWYSALVPAGDAPLEGARKEAYGHAFVILSAAAATCAGLNGARTLLDEALNDQDRHWWEPAFGRVRNSWNRDFSECEPYRGLNANMHMVEAYLAAWDASGERIWLDRAREICRFVADLGARFGWRLPEHFGPNWDVEPKIRADHLLDPFRPYGVVPGHGFEWARLILHTRAALVAVGDTPGAWMLDVARELVNRADCDGWTDEGVGGIVYTTDGDGRALVTQRMHWALCEAVNAAYALGVVEEELGDEAQVAIQSERFARCVAWADQYLRESPGRWIHELDAEGVLSGTLWPGKPDAYHLAHMLLLPKIGLAPGFALALSQLK